MASVLIDIGHLIATDPQRYGGRAVIAGTGTSVRQIVMLYRQGYSADEIAMDKKLSNPSSDSRGPGLLLRQSIDD